jgi:predicted nucleic acid-binding protein
MKLFAIDTNLLVYAYNIDSSFHKKSKTFLELVMNDRTADGKLSVCIPTQVLIEFINVITRKNLEHPVLLNDAIGDCPGIFADRNTNHSSTKVAIRYDNGIARIPEYAKNNI